MKIENKIRRGLSIHSGSGNRTNYEKEFGNDYLNCKYKVKRQKR